MGKRILAVVALSALMTGAQAASTFELIANNKEATSLILKNAHLSDIKKWMKPLGDEAKVLSLSKQALSATFSEFEKRSAFCDVGFVTLLKEKAKSQNLVKTTDDFLAFSSFLRKQNLIDDILFRNILNSSEVAVEMEARANKSKPLRPVNLYTSENEKLDVKELYSAFAKFPDDIKRCSLGNYTKIARQLSWDSLSDLRGQLFKLNYIAWKKGFIELSTYHKLEAIRSMKALEWPIYNSRYMDIVQNAKDKLSETGKPENDPSKNSNIRETRFGKITRRADLYQNYDSTQVMMLSEIIQKTARRIDAHQVTINFQFNQAPSAVDENYVLSPMEKYRLSIKMLRKDIAEVKRSELFNGAEIEFEDLVTAAYETGLIKAEELDYILKFEDFWDPQTPAWKAYANFAFSLAGTASFYLPPPWNIVGAIALVVTQTKVMNLDSQADPDDNWNTVL